MNTYSCKQTVTRSRGVKKKGAKSDVTYCLKVICCRVIKQTKTNKQKTSNNLPGESKLQTVLLNKSSNVLRIIYLKRSMLLTLLIVSLREQPLNWRNKQPPLSLDKTRTYWCFYYFTFNLRTANVCSGPIQSLGRKSSPGSNRSRDI